MSFKITKKILISCFIIISIFGVWLFLNAQKADNIAENNNSSPMIFKEEKDGKADSASLLPPTLTKKYENVQYGFSFSYQSDFAVSEFPEDEGKMSLIIQNEETDQTVQIYITSYDDHDFVVSAERIRSDLPDLPFSNSADVAVGGKAKGVAFFSENEAFGGDTAEVWFADGENFYQATAYGKDAKLLEEIVKSWKFQQNK